MFIFFVVCCGCQRDKKLSDCLTKEEKKDLNYLFRQIIDNESGAYVLLGSKPLCTGFLKIAPKKKSQFWRHPDKGWEAWEKIKKFTQGNRYILTRKPFTIQVLDQGQSGGSMDLHFFVFADVRKTALVLAENYDFFKSFTGMDFHPLEIVFDLENPDSIFWNHIFDLEDREISRREQFNENMAFGLLFGFGKANSLLFSWRSEIGEKGGKGTEFFKSMPLKGSLDGFGENNLVWANFLYEQGINEFLIPGFATFEDDEIVERYNKERKKIQATYHGRDFLEVTLEQLFRKAL